MVREMAATMQAAAKNAQASTKIGEGMLKKGKTLDLTETSKDQVQCHRPWANVMDRFVEWKQCLMWIKDFYRISNRCS